MAQVSAPRWQALSAALVATFLALPASAGIDVPQDPLTTGARVAPNILFILDDSGSMASNYMPDGLANDWRRQSYVHNPVYYDPSKTYQPWMGADGNRLAGGTSYRAVYGDFNLASGSTINLLSTSCKEYERNGSETNVCGGTQTFHVPKQPDKPATFSDRRNFYRYQIHTDGVIVRSEYGPREGTAPNYNRGLSGRDCSTDTGDRFRNCTRVTPGRSEDAEMANFATWFSYHRTRMKAAKAGASEAFATLDGSVRVGYRTIWNRNNFDIPVGDGNDGRFVDNPDDPRTTRSEATTSRTTWYQRLHGAVGELGTPLLPALNRAGAYFSSNSASGPYGPQSGQDQLSCRQNFAILTTDGYWNSGTVDFGNVDGTDGATITGPKNQSYRYLKSSPYKDSYFNTLADVAMYYWNRDLRTESYMTNNVPTSAANPAFWQHMVTFGVSIGLAGNKGWSSVADVPADATWADPTDTEDADRIDDLLHAAVNGRGAFVAASDPTEFAAGLSAALAAIAERTSSSSNVAANSVSLDTGAQIFSAGYVSGQWTGSMTARPVSSAGISSTVTWSATLPAWDSRRIFTSDAGRGSDFPTSNQLGSLARGGGPSNYQVTGEDNAAYIKGNQNLEANRNGNLRVRSGILGDIIGSSPFYVKETNTLYVGANDGMLHAFDAANGRELFAFVPGIVDFTALSTLSRGDYAHRFFVDGPITVSNRRLTPGRNLLVGTLGRGGKGLYSLDVSTPSAFGGGSFKWERVETPEGNMGLVLGKPFLSRVKGRDDVAVILGNGVNSSKDQAALIVLNAENGSVIREITTGTGSASQPNGLFAPTGVYGADGRTLAYVYAGDMLGNVWKFDLTNSNPGLWSAKKIFVAVNAQGKAQPITGGLAIATHPVTNKRWVFFGTGRYLTVQDADPANAPVQSMYGFIDEDRQIARTELTARTLAVTSDTSNGFPVRAFAAKAALPATSKGWYIDLPESGERIIQDAQVVSSFLVTASMVPTGNACDADGRGYINALDAFTGTSAGSSYFDLNRDGKTTDEKLTMGDKSIPVGSVDLGVGMPTLPNLQRGLLSLSGSAGAGGGSVSTLRPRWDRTSWREIRRD
ncbi:MAG TPA: PilC/PilY family type IV pilus protein [Lysobacter sp.]